MVVIKIPSRRIRNYLLENPPSIYIISFIALLIVCAVILASSPGYAALTNNVAVYAYYFLVLGVALQFIEFIRGEKQPISERLQVKARPILVASLMMTASVIALLGLAMIVTGLTQIRSAHFRDFVTELYVVGWGCWTLYNEIGAPSQPFGLTCVLGRATIVTADLPGNVVLWVDVYASTLLMTVGAVTTATCFVRMGSSTLST